MAKKDNRRPSEYRYGRHIGGYQPDKAPSRIIPPKGGSGTRPAPKPSKQASPSPPSPDR